MAEIREEIINPNYIKSCGAQAVLRFFRLSCAKTPPWNIGNTITRKVSAGTGKQWRTGEQLPFTSPMAGVSFCFLHTVRTLTTIFSLCKKTKKSFNLFY